MTDRELINAALAASEKSYSPYSGFKVGAALLCADGSVYQGCNVECAAFGDTVCAEKTAITKAISEGKRRFTMLAVAAQSDTYCMPCGSCRQFIAEFAHDIEILSARSDGRYVSYKLRQLLPYSFDLGEKPLDE
ncbi:MAG: cytidine deaminase [Clostridiales bacterium]|jgi:cytidine deaminase|nr:cytidine deaminase [Clostridiales bacterium]